MDKSKQHWKKVQDRKRKEAERKAAETNSIIKMMDHYTSMMDLAYKDCCGIPMVLVPEHIKEGEKNG